MSTSLSLLFSGFAGVIVGVVISHFSQRKLIGMQIAAANESNEKLVKRIGEQIDQQMRASELVAVGGHRATRSVSAGRKRKFGKSTWDLSCAFPRNLVDNGTLGVTRTGATLE